MTQGSFVLTKLLMRFDAMEAPVSQDKLEKELQSGLTSKNDIKMRFRVRVKKFILLDLQI
jgi:hypothetical protein